MSVASTEDVLSRWLPFRALTGAEPGALPLYCLPHAGGAASAFRGWQRKLPGVAVQPVQPPGRESRHREPPYERMEPLVSDLADAVLADVEASAAGRRYALYGHSLGAIVAFELVREIRRRGGPAPVHLFVSGSDAPHLTYEDGPPVRKMNKGEVAALLRALGGTPEWLLADPEALEMILPAVQADFTVKETYVYRDEPPLGLPISLLTSSADPRVSPAKASGWRALTSAGFTPHPFDGGHFAVFEQAPRTHAIVAEALRPWV
ncbi:thioesterase II family protein [Planomonospora venezuelensis]|uniref:Surfactin synthase thioesterase subunit n=1 Tax=Planomonospora venezuelensis TaxID=1999 RepID=A0A841DL53_PLAVE|nr:thioesterase [Planomonospora venezuelensis]MBB5967836.1 surfactin synthase thioesterase subunit [Planomonospora venezuelensis]GIN01244.1 thioesterase [Planomonospora venezuelensis]